LEGNLSDELRAATRRGAINYLSNNPYVETAWLQGASGNFTTRFQTFFRESLAEHHTLNGAQSATD
jgi:hypothetical protein